MMNIKKTDEVNIILEKLCNANNCMVLSCDVRVSE